jgi:tubulin-specific chaperone A
MWYVPTLAYYLWYLVIFGGNDFSSASFVVERKNKKSSSELPTNPLDFSAAVLVVIFIVIHAAKGRETRPEEAAHDQGQGLSEVRRNRPIRFIGRRRRRRRRRRRACSCHWPSRRSFFIYPPIFLPPTSTVLPSSVHSLVASSFGRVAYNILLTTKKKTKRKTEYKYNNRLVNEAAYYENEVLENESKLEMMKADDVKYDRYDIKKFQEVLSESHMMIPDSKCRRDRALADLKEYVLLLRKDATEGGGGYGESDGDDGADLMTCDWMVEAIKMLGDGIGSSYDGEEGVGGGRCGGSNVEGGDVAVTAVDGLAEGEEF